MELYTNCDYFHKTQVTRYLIIFRVLISVIENYSEKNIFEKKKRVEFLQLQLFKNNIMMYGQTSLVLRTPCHNSSKLKKTNI